MTNEITSDILKCISESAEVVDKAFLDAKAAVEYLKSKGFSINEVNVYMFCFKGKVKNKKGHEIKSKGLIEIVDDENISYEASYKVDGEDFGAISEVISGYEDVKNAIDCIVEPENLIELAVDDQDEKTENLKSIKIDGFTVGEDVEVAYRTVSVMFSADDDNAVVKKIRVYSFKDSSEDEFWFSLIGDDKNNPLFTSKYMKLDDIVPAVEEEIEKVCNK